MNSDSRCEKDLVNVSYRKLVLKTAASCAAVLAPIVLLEIILLQTDYPISGAIAITILLAACAAYEIFIKVRLLALGKKAAAVLWEICQEYPDLALDEEFNCMGILEKVIYVLSHNSSFTRSEYESELLEKQVELFALQAQINPHFLYNTLDSIRGQAVMDGADEIASTIEALSNLFKYNISQRENMIPLRLELDNLIYYMKIQKYRYLDKIDLTMDIENDDSILSTKIPKLTLQPIIENAIYHGLEPKLGKGTIRIRVCKSGDTLCVTIVDDGVGMDEDTLIQTKKRLCGQAPESIHARGPSHGIALYNANRRIQQCFGSNYGISIYSTKMVGTRVELTFPYRKELDGNESALA